MGPGAGRGGAGGAGGGKERVEWSCGSENPEAPPEALRHKLQPKPDSAVPHGISRDLVGISGA